MHRIFILLFSIFFLTACSKETPKWKYVKTIPFDSISPIGGLWDQNNIWISDGDNNRLVQMNTKGEILNLVPGFERPMHIALDDKSILVPEYGKDRISMLIGEPNESITVNLPVDSLDAPAAVSYNNGIYAIADFYHHRVLIGKTGHWTSLGKKGKANSEFHYPTDVQLTDQRLYVADAYNHRVQVFDHQGNWIQTFGQEEKMNAATGIFVSTNQTMITDFENHRVILYNLEGEVEQVLHEHLENPTDLFLVGNTLWVLNYKSKNAALFEQSQ